MKGKLIKIKDNYRLYVINHLSGPELFKGKLSIKNCQAIEKGYDFDEYGEGVFYAGQFGHPSPEGFSDEQIGRLHGFIDGLQKAFELLHDKKYSEEDLINAHYIGWIDRGESDKIKYPKARNKYIQSLQQTEFDVEICCYIGNGDKESDSFQDPIVTNTGIPKLDSDGCLILKRI